MYEGDYSQKTVITIFLKVFSEVIKALLVFRFDIKNSKSARAGKVP